MDPSAYDSDQYCLCLSCRQKGHVVEECIQFKSESIPPPDVGPARPSPPFHPFPISATEELTQALCQRCSHLRDGLSKFTSYCPFTSDDLEELCSRRATKKATQIPSLGPIRSLRLLSTCPLCRLIFDVTHLTDEEMEIVGSGAELSVITAWTMCRLEEYLYWIGLEKGKGPYAKCVYTCVAKWSRPNGVYIPKRPVERAMDAIALLDGEQGGHNDVLGLGVRQVDPKVPDYSLIKNWIRQCENRHRTTCHPLVSDGLKQIKVIDVETRMVVKYPVGCDYIALSYVWGGVEQPSYKLGDVLPTVPATLEDAMVVTRNLGKRYLWADSLCIDQENYAEKAVQIGLMSAIYSGAWATIFCLSGQSARSGLPRVGTLEGVIPQLSCDIWGRRMLSMMPTLSQQVSWSPWASRAWTYQEGLLSPRRLFFTNHQVYFECNSFQGCESLDDTNSPFHLLTDTERRAKLDSLMDVDELIIPGPRGIVGQGVFRDPFRPISGGEDEQVDATNFSRYKRIVHSYTTRKMTHDADSLNAFSAMLTRLEENDYQSGLLQGLPLADLPKAMLWFHSTSSRRRVDFPTWSWAGWEGGVSKTDVHGNGELMDAIMPPLRIWKAGNDNEPQLIYNFNPTPYILKAIEELTEEESHPQNGEHDEEHDEESNDDWEDEEDTEGSWSSLDSVSSSDIESGTGSFEGPYFYKKVDFRNDPVFRLAQTTTEDAPALPARMNGNELLLIEGILIRVDLTESQWSNHQSDDETDDEYDGECFIQLDGRRQRMRFHDYNATQLANQRRGNQQECLLVSRRHGGIGQRVCNVLILLDLNGDVADRVGVATLTLDGVELLDHLDPERRSFKLR